MFQRDHVVYKDGELKANQTFFFIGKTSRLLVNLLTIVLDSKLTCCWCEVGYGSVQAFSGFPGFLQPTYGHYQPLGKDQPSPSGDQRQVTISASCEESVNSQAALGQGKEGAATTPLCEGMGIGEKNLASPQATMSLRDENCLSCGQSFPVGKRGEQVGLPGGRFLSTSLSGSNTLGSLRVMSIEL